MAKEVKKRAKDVAKDVKREKAVAFKPNAKDQKNLNAVAKDALVADGREERPFTVRVLTVGVSSYLAQKVWTKRKILTNGWHTQELTETEQGMVTAFEYMSSMGLIFVIGIVVGVVFSKVAKWVKGAADQQ